MAVGHVRADYLQVHDAAREHSLDRNRGRLAVYGGLPYSLGMPPSAARRTASPHERKTARLELRITPSIRKLIERATAVSGLAAGDLAYEGARRVLEDHERMVLRGADRETFLEAIANPPAPSPRLIAALRKHRKIAG
jgi:uncharacterized protein (DUF1778 family)